MMRQCGLCLQLVPKLADSHVYPRALQRLMHTEDKPAFVIRANASHPARTASKSLSGVHGYFVCPACERDAFQDGDNEFMALYHRLAAKPVSFQPGQEERHVIVPGNPDLIHRFALQTLWRWYACPEAGLNESDLGSLYERLRGWLARPGGTLRTGWGVAVHNIQGPLTMAALPPMGIGGPNRKLFALTLPSFALYIAADRCWLPGGYEPITLRAGSGVNMFATPDVPKPLLAAYDALLTPEVIERTDAYLQRFEAKKP